MHKQSKPLRVNLGAIIGIAALMFGGPAAASASESLDAPSVHEETMPNQPENVSAQETNEPEQIDDLDPLAAPLPMEITPEPPGDISTRTDTEAEPSPAAAAGDSVPVDNGAAAVVHYCEWAPHAEGTYSYPSCAVDVAVPDMEPRAYTVNLRDIEATHAFVALGVDTTKWWWGWERDHGPTYSFVTSGEQVSTGGRLDMSPRPIAPPEPWSCFDERPAPPGVGYEHPAAPEPYVGAGVVGEPLTIALSDMLKGSAWQTSFLSPDSPIRPTGPDSDGSFSWTPTEAGVFEFHYILGAPNCVLGAHTGTITVSSPAVVIGTPSAPPSDLVVATWEDPARPALLANTGSDLTLLGIIGALVLASGISLALASLSTDRRGARRCH